MISWHRRGQKVTPVDGAEWPVCWIGIPENEVPGFGDRPEHGCIYTVTDILHNFGIIFFRLAEIPVGFFNAAKFRPVYPTIIEDLLTRAVSTPARGPAVKEDA